MPVDDGRVSDAALLKFAEAKLNDGFLVKAKLKVAESKNATLIQQLKHAENKREELEEKVLDLMQQLAKAEEDVDEQGRFFSSCSEDFELELSEIASELEVAGSGNQALKLRASIERNAKALETA